MFSADMRAIYRRLMILGLLSMCLTVLVLSDNLSNASATAPCIQDCEATEAMCMDSCSTACAANSTDANCNSCILNCSNQANSCYSNAVWCSQPGINYTARCSNEYGLHCPVISGTADCSHPDAHYNFYQLCNNVSGGSSFQCVSCPGYDYCYGSNGLPPCY